MIRVKCCAFSHHMGENKCFFQTLFVTVEINAIGLSEKRGPKYYWSPGPTEFLSAANTWNPQAPTSTYDGKEEKWGAGGSGQKKRKRKHGEKKKHGKKKKIGNKKSCVGRNMILAEGVHGQHRTHLLRNVLPSCKNRHENGWMVFCGILLLLNHLLVVLFVLDYRHALAAAASCYPVDVSVENVPSCAAVEVEWMSHQQL